MSNEVAQADTRESLYERLGGEAAIDAAVEIFYQKLLADDQINGFFEGVDVERQAAKQRAFLTYAFGGPNRYTGRTMRAAHAKAVTAGLDDTHFDAVVEHLAATLRQLGVAADLTEEVVAIAASTRDDVLGR
jgi:hemoglobin